jgi:hypothetical protein
MLGPRAGALAFVLVATFAVPRSVAACPDCAVGRQARAAVVRDDFGKNLFVALLPFLLIGAVCLRVETIGRDDDRDEGPRS